MSGNSVKIFVVEDNEWYNKLLVHNLSLNPDFEVKSFTSAKELLKNISENPSIVTLDYRLPDSTGEEILKQIKEFNNDIEVIIISEQEEIETAVELLKLGAYDYIVKSKQIKERLFATINNILKNVQLKERVNTLQKEVEKKYDFQSTIIGNSEAIKKIYTYIEKAIKTNITVSVTGETGTGKEVIAKAIHYNSVRSKKPFVAVNMAALPPDLIESELFGHEKGAFTGASYTRIGKFEEANGGTLFLDEIGEMDINFQAKLLRAIQEKEIVKVGSNKPKKIDCRIIVATNKNLKEQVKNGKFREDLFYRLYGLPIELPPLRERGKDVILLSNFFIKNFCKDNDLKIKKMSEEAHKKLLSYGFPGNIRELKSTIELAVVMSSSDVIEADDITLSTGDILPEVLSEELTMKEYNLKILATYLKKYDSNVNLVSEKLEISPATIYRMMKDL